MFTTYRYLCQQWFNRPVNCFIDSLVSTLAQLINLFNITLLSSLYILFMIGIHLYQSSFEHALGSFDSFLHCLYLRIQHIYLFDASLLGYLLWEYVIFNRKCLPNNKYI